MEYRGKQWHDSCFCCCVCKNTIGSNSFIPKNDEIYCKLWRRDLAKLTMIEIRH